MNQLVGDLLDVARVTQGKISLQKQHLALDEIIASVTRNLQRLADAKKLELNLKIDSTIYVNGDALRLEQIVNNLITNAIKYTDQGSVTVELRAEEENALFIVSDTGTGIDEQLLPHLFDLFSQAERTLARSEGGLGVGLTIVKQLVELHSGSIEAHSKGKDQGSVFRVYLPLDTTSVESNKHSHSRERKNPDRQLKVLLVEDNPDVVETLSLILQLWNYQTITAEDGEAAIRIASDEQPDVVLLDIGLPILDGYHVAQTLRENYPSHAMKLIAMTGYAQREDKDQAHEAQDDDMPRRHIREQTHNESERLGEYTEQFHWQ
ncbi:MAG: response regulator, partial [Proteobacteria bacterium]